MKGIKFLIGAAVLAAGVVAVAGSASAAEVYAPDKVHSTIGFTVSHMMVSKVTGSFNDYDGTIQFDAKDLANSRLEATIKVDSIDTRNEKRDEHLKSGEFFDAPTYPTITFKSKKIEPKQGNDYLVTGDLTMKAVTKEISFPATILGPVTNPMDGGKVLGLEAHLTINRQDYGVSFNKTLDNGGLMVGNDVDVSILIEAHK